MTIQFTGPTGIDGRQLIDDAARGGRWTIWNYEEIYWGANTPPSGIYIPKVNDLIENTTLRRTYIVTAVDPNTYVPRIRAYVHADDSESDDNSLVYAVGVGQQADLRRLYVNKNVLPYSAVIDNRVWVGGSDTKYAIVYRGSIVDGGVLEPISIMYDANSNQILGNQIPLEKAEAPGTVYTNTWVAKPFHTKVDLQDNEIVSVVFYNSQNTMVASSMLLVSNTAWMRDASNQMRYITDIYCESPFINPSDPNLIVYPLNLPKNGLNLFGVVLYSDGSQVRLPVDGRKFTMLGLDDFVATWPNQTDKWVLRYSMDENEAMIGGTVGEQYAITKEYDVKVTQVQGMYSVKLYPFPVWNNGLEGYTLRWFLYTLERDSWQDVTPYVQVGSNNPAFDPKLYGANQQIQWVIKLADVNPIYGNWEHTQVINISLLRQGTENIKPRWTVRDQGYTDAYGQNTFCAMRFENQNLRYLNFGSGLANRTDWLRNAYYRLNPLYDSQAESEAPEPDFMILRTSSGASMELSVDDWNRDIPVSFVINNHDTVYLHFIKRTATMPLELAVGGWSVFQTN